jgi:FixJ family two-component response regulator
MAAGAISMMGHPRMHGVVHVVDDDASFCTAVGRILRAVGLEPVLYGSAREYLAADDSRGPACVLLDLHLPDATGLDLQAELRGHAYAHPIVFLTGYGDIRTSVQAIKAGAIDFLTKPVEMDTLLDSLAVALERDGENHRARERLAELAQRYATLTRRERQVMSGVVIGLLNKQIAFALQTAERTVKTHRSRVMGKMGAGCVPDLVHIADSLRLSGLVLEPLEMAPRAHCQPAPWAHNDHTSHSREVTCAVDTGKCA